jgi:hypothetical protein
MARHKRRRFNTNGKSKISGRTRALQPPGHAILGFSDFSGLSRVSRLRSWGHSAREAEGASGHNPHRNNDLSPGRTVL